MRVRMWPRVATGAVCFTVLFESLAGAAAVDAARGAGLGALIAGFVLGTLAFTLGARVAYECATATAALLQSLAWVAEAQRAMEASDSITLKVRLTLQTRAALRSLRRAGSPDASARAALADRSTS
jgi:hypothetical protein